MRYRRHKRVEKILMIIVKIENLRVGLCSKKTELLQVNLRFLSLSSISLSAYGCDKRDQKLPITSDEYILKRE